MEHQQAIFLIRKDIEESISRNEIHLKEQSITMRKCGKSSCEYCERIGIVKATFARTKPLLKEMLRRLANDATPRLFIDHHRRNEFANYQAWILPNGHYVNVWKIGGHSLFSGSCSGEMRGGMIKVHAQYRNNILIYDVRSPPTCEQMETLRDIYADAIFHGYPRRRQLSLLFNYNVFHPRLTIDDEPF